MQLVKKWHCLVSLASTCKLFGDLYEILVTVWPRECGPRPGIRHDLKISPGVCFQVATAKKEKEVDGKKETVDVTIRDCDTSKYDNCNKFLKHFLDNDEYSDGDCYYCHPDKCNADSRPTENKELESVNGGAVVVLSNVLLILLVVKHVVM
jgi:hypothetical protein